MQLYIDTAPYIRAVAYVGLAGYFIYWSASLASTGHRLRAVILLITSFYWSGASHFALSGNSLIQPFVWLKLTDFMYKY